MKMLIQEINIHTTNLPIYRNLNKFTKKKKNLLVNFTSNISNKNVYYLYGYDYFDNHIIKMHSTIRENCKFHFHFIGFRDNCMLYNL